jgi:hypothetical protein
VATGVASLLSAGRRAALWLLVPSLVFGAVMVKKSDREGLEFRYVPGGSVLGQDVPGRTTIELEDAEHLAEPGEL